MYNLIAYISAAEPLGAVRDAYNAKNAAAPTMIIGVGTTLKLRLFADAEGQTGYPLDALTAVSSWRWIMDNDWDSATAPPIVADNADITVATVTDDINGSQMTFTEVTIPISNLNSAELQTLLGSSETVSGLNGQLTGYDENGEAAFILQVKNFTIRNRLDAAGEPTEVDPEWLNEAQVRALISTAAPRISADNTWIVNGIDTGVSANGTPGPQGEPGAYLQPTDITDSTSTTATIAELAENVRYVYTLPLTSLTVSAVPDSAQETEIQFTAGTGITVSLPADVGVMPTGGVVFAEGGSYIINFRNRIAVIASYTPGA